MACKILRRRRNQPHWFSKREGIEKKSGSYYPPTHPQIIDKTFLCRKVALCRRVLVRGCPRTLTSTVLLIGPVLTVVLPVTLPPVGDAVAILTLELEVAGAVWGFRGVFWGR